MPDQPPRLTDRLRIAGRSPGLGASLLAFVPALTLAGYWFGGEGFLLIASLTLPAALGLAGLLTPEARPARARRDGTTGLPLAPAAVEALDRAFAESGTTGRSTAALALEIDDMAALSRQFGQTAAGEILRTTGARLRKALREGDLLARDGTDGFVVALEPVQRLDLEALVQLSTRLQKSLDDPIRIGGQGVHVTLGVGFCLPRRPAERQGEACLAAARAALADAQIAGPGSIRSYAPHRAVPAAPADDLAEELPAALDAGRIRAWFQPLLSTETGRVSGMEALARWEHPARGVIAPAAFLPAVEGLGLQRQLTAAMLDGALEAVSAWDAAGCDVPCVSVNFSGADLADPMLADRVAWALDRLDLAATRLTVEVLETVIAETGEDAVTRTISRLGDLGCTIALDDFGTGQAAIGAIRRFGVHRIKIDRSFVRRIDTDPDQHMMLTAILDLAGRLRVETVAEGVETVGEHALLAQLGCDHVQGYAVARPMPAADTFGWLRRHKANAAQPGWPGRRTG